MSDTKRLGAQIRKLRLEAGLTQREMAQRTGMHRPVYCALEGGKRGAHSMQTDTLKRIAQALGVRCVDIVYVLDDVADAAE